MDPLSKRWRSKATGHVVNKSDLSKGGLQGLNAQSDASTRVPRPTSQLSSQTSALNPQGQGIQQYSENSGYYQGHPYYTQPVQQPPIGLQWPVGPLPQNNPQPVTITGPPFGFQQTSPPLPHSSPQFPPYASPTAIPQDWSPQPTHHTYNQTHFSPPPGPHPQYPSQEPQAQLQAYNGYANQQFDGRRTPDRSTSYSWAPSYNNQCWNDINPVQRVATAPAAPTPYHPFEHSCVVYWNA
ncbi:hypothetical protein EJ07DRAFT_159967 [Lizonia empirigonia]|nr:hypothetical protein EJ07DRAFT_159967 [Lizonia empirigonia]